MSKGVKKYKVKHILSKNDLQPFDKIKCTNINHFKPFGGALSSIIIISYLQQFTRKISIWGFDMYRPIKNSTKKHIDYIEHYMPAEIAKGRNIKKHRETVHDLFRNEQWFKDQVRRKRITFLNKIF